MSDAAGIDVSTAPLGPGVSILGQDASGLVALDKPTEILSHPNTRADERRSLLATNYDQARQCFTWADPQGASHCAHLLHRLDGATSGVILIATNEELAVEIRSAFESRSVSKRYLAVVLGHPREKRALWRDRIQVTREDGALRARSEGGAMAETAMRCLRLIPGPPALAVLELEPHTGRTHQLRHQCARRRLPILGDQNYGNFKLNRELARRIGTDRLFLHARSIAVEFRYRGENHRFSAVAPEPKEFAVWTGRR